MTDTRDPQNEEDWMARCQHVSPGTTGATVEEWEDGKRCDGLVAFRVTYERDGRHFDRQLCEKHGLPFREILSYPDQPNPTLRVERLGGVG